MKQSFWMRIYPLAAALVLGLASVLFGVANAWNEFALFAVIGWTIGLHEQRLDRVEKAHDRLVDRVYDEGVGL